MHSSADLQKLERKAFQTTHADGLWDVFIGLFALQFAIAPLLSESLGDFWSSVIFLPVWAVAYLGIWLARKHLVAPRLGTFKIGAPRQQRLRRTTLLMLAVNVLLLGLGIAAAVYAAQNPGSQSFGYMVSFAFSLTLLVGFSLAGWLLDFPRLYLYAVLLFAAIPVGEWLYQNMGAGHHGYPIVFGFSAGLMISLGLVLFIRVLRSPLPQGPEGGAV